MKIFRAATGKMLYAYRTSSSAHVRQTDTVDLVLLVLRRYFLLQVED
jgi:hypothetical protein